MASEFWLSDRQRAAIEPPPPRDQPGAWRVDDRRAIRGIVRMLGTGGRWQDCPRRRGPPTTIHNRHHRRIERTVGRLEERRRIHVRLGKLARHHASAMDIAAILTGRC